MIIFASNQDFSFLFETLLWRNALKIKKRAITAIMSPIFLSFFSIGEGCSEQSIVGMVFFPHCKTVEHKDRLGPHQKDLESKQRHDSLILRIFS